jgi:hypothetical protein
MTNNRCRLTRLSLRNCNVDDMDMLTLPLGLAYNNSLLELRLDHNSITTMGILYFCQYWSDDSPLQEVGFELEPTQRNRSSTFATCHYIPSCISLFIAYSQSKDWISWSDTHGRAKNQTISVVC